MTRFIENINILDMLTSWTLHIERVKSRAVFRSDPDPVFQSGSGSIFFSMAGSSQFQRGSD